MQSSRFRILVAEDETSLRNLTRITLETLGHQVVAVKNGAEALAEFGAQPFDLVLLDVMMPKIDGFEVCEQIRKSSRVPIVMLTGLGDTEDMVRGLELGADDYIPKPFTLQEVLARINAVMRRVQRNQQESQAAIIHIGEVTAISESEEVFVGQRAVRFSPLEFRLLFALMANAGKVLRKDEMVLRVWGYEFVGSYNLVEVTVRRVREKIELNPAKPQYILTVRGVGYKFRAPHA